MPSLSETVDGLFVRLAARYGSAWFAKWQGIPIEALKADWREELDGISEKGIRYGIEHLPADFAPNAAQFRALCINRPEEPPMALPAPKANPARVAAVICGLKEKFSNRKPRDWAYELQKRERIGVTLSPSQREAMKESLTTVPLQAIGGDFRPIPEHCLPPGMRKSGRNDEAAT